LRGQRQLLDQFGDSLSDRFVRSHEVVATFYDQTHPQSSVERIVGFREQPKGPKKRRHRVGVIGFTQAGCLRDPEPRLGNPADGTIRSAVFGGLPP